MPNHWKEIIENSPQLASVGMVVGVVDGFIEGLPYTVKVVALTVALVGVYSDLKTDLAVINAQNAHASVERGIFQEFMSAGDRCTKKDCIIFDKRLDRIEALYIHGDK